MLRGLSRPGPRVDRLRGKNGARAAHESRRLCVRRRARRRGFPDRPHLRVAGAPGHRADPPRAARARICEDIRRDRPAAGVGK